MNILIRFFTGIFSGCLRRLLGGWLSTKKIISERGIQYALGIILYSLVILYQGMFGNGYDTFLYSWLPFWAFDILASVVLVACLTIGHFPGFLCGTENLDYINEQKAEGRKIPFESLINWFGEKRGFIQFGKEWCFWQLFLCKTIAMILPSVFFGVHFLFLGPIIAFAYPAMFWVELKNVKNFLTSPTNWGEYWQGYFIIWGLLC